MRTMPKGPWDVDVVIAESEADWVRIMRRNKHPAVPWPGRPAVTRLTLEGGYIVLVACFDQLKLWAPAERCGVIAHETQHIWQYIFEHIGGQHLDMEVEACNIEWIFNWLFRELAAMKMVRAR